MILTICGSSRMEPYESMKQWRYCTSWTQHCPSSYCDLIDAFHFLTVGLCEVFWSNRLMSISYRNTKIEIRRCLFIQKRYWIFFYVLINISIPCFIVHSVTLYCDCSDCSQKLLKIEPCVFRNPKSFFYKIFVVTNIFQLL